MKSFCHLHNHGEFSALDGMSRAEQMMEIAKADGQPAIALTDHGVVAGAPEFYAAARKADILPILGQEFYIVPDSSVKDKKSESFVSNRHLVMLSLNETGWHTLVELTSLANDRNRYHYRPRIDHRVLQDYASMGSSNPFDNLAVLSACLSGEINRGLETSEEEADKVVKFYKSVFPNFYLELQKHPILKKYRKTITDARSRSEQDFAALQDRLNSYLIRASKRFKLPLVITNDGHYADKDKAEVHEMLLAIQRQVDWNDPDRWRFAGTGYWIKTTEEMKQLWRSYPDIWKQSQKSIATIVGQAKGLRVSEFESTTWHFPDIPGQDKDPVRLVRRRCERALRDLGLQNNKVYTDRLRHELSVIREANFEQIFLIVDEYVTWAKSRGILVGPGRGSMVGVLVSYLLGITDIDPVKFRLLFERAINPARPSIPDFDIDFESERIEEVIDHVRDRFGADNVALIGTHQTMAPRLTVKSVLKALGVPFQLSTEITSELPDIVDITNNKTSKGLEAIFEQYSTPALASLIEQHPILRPACIELQGLVKSYGTHAAGVVISDRRRPLEHEIPAMLIASSGKMSSQYDMDAVKKLHLIKFDFLRLTTLRTIAQAIEYIGHDPLVEMRKTQEYDDPDVYRMMSRGDLFTVFQYQGGAAKQCILEMGVDNFEDLVAVNAIARPGAINFLPNYIAGKRNPKGISYPCREVKSILEYTYGVILYQEQVMEIVKVLSGWDDLGADRIKEAIKSKSGNEFDEMKVEFLAGCKKNKISNEAAEAVWQNIDDYRAYGFNRAHSVAYSVIGYQTAYLKYHYPKEWLTAVLNTDAKSKQLSQVVDEIRRIHVPLLLPDINVSDRLFTIREDGIQYGLELVRGIGPKVADLVIAERETFGAFTSCDEFRARMSVYGSVCNFTKADAFIQSGAMANIGGIKPSAEQEIQLLGAYVQQYPLDPYRKKMDKALFSDDNRKTLDQKVDGMVYWGGLVSKVKEIRTKKGELMAFVGVTYYGETWDIVMFPAMWRQWGGSLKLNRVVAIAGRKDANRNSIVCEQMKVVA